MLIQTGNPDINQNLLRFMHFCSVNLQQHGSIFWKEGASSVLQNLSPDLPLHQSLKVVLHLGRNFDAAFSHWPVIVVRSFSSGLLTLESIEGCSVS